MMKDHQEIYLEHLFHCYLGFSRRQSHATNRNDNGYQKDMHILNEEHDLELYKTAQDSNFAFCIPLLRLRNTWESSLTNP